MSNTTILQIETFDSDKLLSEFKRINEKLNLLSNKKSTHKENPAKPYYSRKELKEMLGVSYPTLNNWAKKGILRPCRLGSRIIYKEKDLESAILSTQSS